MKRTKPKSVKTPSGSKTVSTQTDNLDSFIEVAKLEEQVRLLQLENNVLRKHAENSNNSDKEHRKSIYFTPQTTSKSSCGCKGNCSSRICGCVKRSNKCNPSCKCDEEICENQDVEYNENKENVNTTEMETAKKQSKKNNEAVEKIKKNKGLFSPDIRVLDKDLEEYEFSDIHFSFNERNTIIKDSRTDSNNIDNVELKKKKKEEKKEKNKEQQELTEKVIFNPMKPRHQLSRTPPHSKKLDKPFEHTVPQLHFESDKNGKDETIALPNDQDVKEEKVDWEKHTAQLIPCKKCKRTFLPSRIQKHEACCKKI